MRGYSVGAERGAAMRKQAWSIRPVANAELLRQVTAHLDSLTKPPGSLGRLEELVVRYCLCRGRADADIERAMVCTFAGDHGITEERITPYPSEVTAQMVANMAAGGAAVSVMARAAGIESRVIDVGVKAGIPWAAGVVRRNVARGVRNSVRGPAMTTEECDRAVDIGADIARTARTDLLAVGDMGIGNTAASSALYALLLELDPTDTVGPGTGSAGAVLERKREAVARAVARHRAEWDGSPLDALRRVGGLEIAAMSGFLLAAAAGGVPVVVDGFIASVSALIAMRMEPAVKDYLIFSHASAEPFHRDFLAREGIRPLLDLDMRLGEGTGAVLAIQIMRQALNCYHNMATFSSAGVSDKQE
ncbi:MAG: nicotinate-nucleotide--dimethylbenzimidazole phosphoribosyltransferase [Chitinivibrionales bacterium]|nr:nicotinate-nucleotide--dimethylbenzimidazole phosphoribosyltransferase [Chitinivibrionales bacterium]